MNNWEIYFIAKIFGIFNRITSKNHPHTVPEIFLHKRYLLNNF